MNKLDKQIGARIDKDGLAVQLKIRGHIRLRANGLLRSIARQKTLSPYQLKLAKSIISRLL